MSDTVRLSRLLSAFTQNTLSLALASLILSPLPLTAATVEENLHAIHLPEAWAKGFSGKGVKIGVLDLGVDDAHAAFAGKQVDHIPSDDYLKNFSGNPQWASRNHGTHVAGIMAGHGYGAAPGADILDLTVSWLDLTRTVAETKTLYDRAFDLFPNVKVYNNSWGWVYSIPDYTGISTDLTPVYNVFKRATDEDKLLVFAAGNHGGLAPSSPVYEGITSHRYDGHLINVVNIDAAHLDDPDHYVFKSHTTSLYDTNLGVLAPLWTLAAPGTSVPSASAGTTNETIEMTGTSMASPYVTGTLALVQEAFPWMSAEQLADTVLTTATPSQSGAYEVFLYNGDNPDWQKRSQIWVHGWTDFQNGDIENERAVIAFWGDRGQYQTREQITEFLTRLAEKLIEPIYESDREVLEFMGPDAAEQLEEMKEKWIRNFVDTAIIAEYALGAGRLDASRAVGGPAAVDINRLARWNESTEKWTLPLGNNLSGQSQINYSLTLSGDGVSRFTNDITEIRWNPVLHISTAEDLKSYSEALKKGEPWAGSDETLPPDHADKPIGMIVSGENKTGENIVNTAGTLVLESDVTLSGSIDVRHNAALIVNGNVSGRADSPTSDIPRGLVQSDGTGTIGGTGHIANLISRGILSPGDDTASGRTGTLTVTETLTIDGGTVTLDVGNTRHDLIRASTIDIRDNDLTFALRPSEYIRDTFEFRPADYLLTGNDLNLTDKADAIYLGMSFGMNRTGNGSWQLARYADSMQRIGSAADLSPDAQSRATRLDNAIRSGQALPDAASRLVYWFDLESAGLESDPLAAGRIRTTYDALKSGDHAAFDALALERTIRLREMSGLSPAAPLADHGPQSVASLHVERDRLGASANHLESKRTIVTGGAEVGTEDTRFGWRLGGFSENVDGSAHNTSAKNYGLFGTVSIVKALDNIRLFGDAMAGWVHDHRERSLWGAGNSEHFDVVTTGWTAGASAGFGYRLKPAENLAVLPYLKLSYDTLRRGSFDEGDSPIAQSWSSDRLSATAAEAGLDWQLSMKESRQGTWAFEGRIAYRNRFHLEGADHYRWAGISDYVEDSFRNRHTGRLQVAIAREIPLGHTFRLAAAGETGNTGFTRWGLEGHWSYRF